MSLNYVQLLAIAAQATLKAGHEVLRQYNLNYSTVSKADGSPVTSADIAANDILLEALVPTKINIVSEESERGTHDERQTHPYWCLDPIDGTQDFVDGTDEFCVSVGLIEDDTSKLGLLYAPAMNLFYFAAEGLGTYKYIGTESELLNRTANEGVLDWLLENSVKLPAQELPSTPKFMASRYHRHPKVEAYLEELKKTTPNIELITMGSAIKLGLMAERKAKVYVRYTRFNFWDVAGGHAICKYAGLELLKPHTDQPISYKREDMRIHGYEMKW